MQYNKKMFIDYFNEIYNVATNFLAEFLLCGSDSQLCAERFDRLICIYYNNE